MEGERRIAVRFSIKTWNSSDSYGRREKEDSWKVHYLDANPSISYGRREDSWEVQYQDLELFRFLWEEREGG